LREETYPQGHVQQQLAAIYIYLETETLWCHAPYFPVKAVVHCSICSVVGTLYSVPPGWMNKKSWARHSRAHEGGTFRIAFMYALRYLFG
jgi:hypothetical protein